MLVMDNASFHHSANLEQMCADAGVKLIHLPPYSPDFNLIEELFVVLKMYIKRHWKAYEDETQDDFGAFLEWCVDRVGKKEKSAEDHFRHAGLVIEWTEKKRSFKCILQKISAPVRCPIKIQLFSCSMSVLELVKFDHTLFQWKFQTQGCKCGR